MGILNLTPDSFFDGGKYLKLDDAIAHSKQMVKDGAKIIDIGGESSRPFSKSVSVKDELNRVLPVVEALKSEINAPLSIDTYKYEVAKECLKAGVSILNDISALNADPRIASLVVKYNSYVVLMHMQGNPQNMQLNPSYKNLISDIKSFLHERIFFAKKKGISDEKIIIDPGLGFGKTVNHNYLILNQLSKFLDLNCPILVGPSRKSFIGKKLKSEKSNRLFGTAATIAISVNNGAKIFRVHDVKQMKDVITISDAIISTKEKNN